MRERLELIDEFVDQLPEPLVGQFELHGLLGVEDVIKQVTVVEEATESLLEVWLQSRVDVTEVELLVEDQENGVVLHNVNDVLLLWPRRLIEELLGYLEKRVLVEILHLENLAFVDAIAEIDEELANHLRNLTVRAPVVQTVRLGGIVVVGVVLKNYRVFFKLL